MQLLRAVAFAWAEISLDLSRRLSGSRPPPIRNPIVPAVAATTVYLIRRPIRMGSSAASFHTAVSDTAGRGLTASRMRAQDGVLLGPSFFAHSLR